MNNILARSAAYLILLFGCILCIACILGAAAVFIYLSQYTTYKVWLLAGGCIVLAIIIGVLTIAVFELLLESGEKEKSQNEVL